MIDSELKKEISKLIASICCCGTLPTTDGMPLTDGSTRDNVRLDPTTGIIWYWDGDSWEEFATGGGGFFTSSVNALGEVVTQDANFGQYSIENLDTLTITTGNNGTIHLVNEGLTGDALVSSEDGQALLEYVDDSGPVASVQATSDTSRLLVINGSDIATVLVTANTLSLGNSSREYYFADTDSDTIPDIPTDDNGTSTHVLSFNETNGQWFSTPKPKMYTALLNQTGTNAPVATVLENTTGAITWNYDGVGFYYATISGGFDNTKTVVFVQQGNGAWGGSVTGNVSTDIDTGTGRLYLYVQNAAGGAVNDWGAPLAIEIKIYP